MFSECSGRSRPNASRDHIREAVPNIDERQKALRQFAVVQQTLGKTFSIDGIVKKNRGGATDLGAAPAASAASPITNGSCRTLKSVEHS
jgi:hypothetical protein